MPAAERRRLLLERAAEIVRDEGYDALTMEALVRRAGVSRGLGYVHFKNAHEVALALYEHELSYIYQRLMEATAGEPSLDDSIRAALAAYFDYVEERGNLLSVLQTRLSAPERARPLDAKLAMLLGAWAQQLSQQLDIAHRHAISIAGAMLAAADAYIRSWQSETLDRERAFQLCARFLIAGARAAATDADP